MRNAKWWLDAAVAALLTVLAQAELFYDGAATVPVCLVSLTITGAVALRRIAPVPAAAVTVGAFGLQAVLFDPAPESLGNAIALLVAAYSAAAGAGPLVSVPVLALAAVSFTAYEADQGSLGPAGGDLVMTATVWAIGWFVWRRRRELRRRVATAESQARAADARADEAMAEERRRIARELHDVVSHAVTVVVLQARGGRAMLDRDPAQTRSALDAIEASGQEALADMRRLVTLLREPAGDTAPQPGLGDLPALVNATPAGSAVGLAVTGREVSLGTGIDLTAYRLVQEALTNALRHAPGSTVDVTVHYGPSTVDVAIANGRGCSASGGATGGHGLLGLRERVELYGGTLNYGPEASGGWRVVGRLPYADTGEYGGTA